MFSKEIFYLRQFIALYCGALSWGKVLARHPEGQLAHVRPSVVAFGFLKPVLCDWDGRLSFTSARTPRHTSSDRKQHSVSSSRVEAQVCKSTPYRIYMCMCIHVLQLYVSSILSLRAHSSIYSFIHSFICIVIQKKKKYIRSSSVWCLHFPLSLTLSKALRVPCAGSIHAPDLLKLFLHIKTWRVSVFSDIGSL